MKPVSRSRRPAGGAPTAHTPPAPCAEVAELRAFVAVARAGTVGEAATRLGRTQPSISARLARLEAAWGVRLFRRVARGMLPTPEGARLLPLAEASLRTLEELDRAAGLPLATARELRIGAGDALGRELLPAALSRLLKRQHAPDVYVREGPGPALLDALRDGEIDLALVVEEPGNAIDGIDVEPWIRSAVDLLAPRGFRAGRRGVGIGSLRDARWVTLQRGSAFRRFLEQAFSSAIHAVVQPEKPVIYFLTGHGERDIADYSPATGYSAAARALRRDNLDVRRLIAAATGGIPDDCDLLVVAGPSKQLSREEVELVADYLNRNGRALFLLDPYSHSGLDSLLARWGVEVAEEVVVGMTLTGRELLVSSYGDHPITRNLRNVQTMFYLPRMLQPVATLKRGAHQVDRPTVTVLASNTEKGWAEADPETRPPHFDPASDQRGPVPLAVAVERGTVAGIDVEIKPTRLVVVGDSYFVSNASLKVGVGGNIDFFMSAVNWLLEREELMAISARDPQRVELALDRRLVQVVFLLAVVAVPGLVALTGGLIWWKRRR